MRINIVGKDAYSSNGFTSAGGTLTGPLKLSGNPTTDLEASTKNYVDLAKNSVSASNITTGTLSLNRLPAFTGDFSSASGTNTLTLANSGVAAGTYAKVTVDVKGRVTAATSLVAADIPNLSWNKITTGKPTTLTGYGITDGVNTAGDNLTGHLTLPGNPTTATQLATKGYVDSVVPVGGGTSLYKTGDIIKRTSSTTPSGFLQCNGGQVSKTTYSGLYAVIGDNFRGIKSIPGVGKPWENQHRINTTETGFPSGTWTPLQANQIYNTSYLKALFYGKVFPIENTTNNIRYLYGFVVESDYANNRFPKIVRTSYDTSGLLTGPFTNYASLSGIGSSDFGDYRNPEVLIYKNKVFFFPGGGGRIYVFNFNETTGDIDPNYTKLMVYANGNYYTYYSVYLIGDRLYFAGGVLYGERYTGTFYITLNSDGTIPNSGGGVNLTNGPANGNIPDNSTLGELGIFVIGNRVYYYPNHNPGYLSYNVLDANGNFVFSSYVNTNVYFITRDCLFLTNKAIYTYNPTPYADYNVALRYPINADYSITSGGTAVNNNNIDLPVFSYNGYFLILKNTVYVQAMRYDATSGISLSLYKSNSNFVGTPSNYKTYTDGSLLPTSSTNFYLPNLTNTFGEGIYSFIKT